VGAANEALTSVQEVAGEPKPEPHGTAWSQSKEAAEIGKALQQKGLGKSSDYGGAHVAAGGPIQSENTPHGSDAYLSKISAKKQAVAQGIPNPPEAEGKEDFAARPSCSSPYCQRKDAEINQLQKRVETTEKRLAGCERNIAEMVRVIRGWKDYFRASRRRGAQEPGPARRDVSASEPSAQRADGEI
jgi:hypothetical protein